MWPEDMTEEEILALILAQQQHVAQNQNLQYDAGMPSLFNSVNDFGQGHEFLNMDSEPNSWRRASDARSQVNETLRMTGQYLDELIPGLPREVLPPTAEPYVDYDAALYSGPAYDAVRQAVAAGTPFDIAVNTVLQDEEFQPYLPKNEDNDIDGTGFRQNAGAAIAGSTEGQARNSEYERQLAEYDAYINGENLFTSKFGGEENFDRLVRQYIREVPQNPGTDQAWYLGDAALGRPVQAGATGPSRTSPADQRFDERADQYAERGGDLPEMDSDEYWTMLGVEEPGASLAGNAPYTTPRPQVPSVNRSGNRVSAARARAERAERANPRPTTRASAPSEPRLGRINPALFNQSLNKYADMTRERASARRDRPLQEIRAQMLLQAANALATGSL